MQKQKQKQKQKQTNIKRGEILIFGKKKTNKHKNG